MKKFFGSLLLALALCAPVCAQHSVALTWTPPTGYPAQDLKYNVYRAPCLMAFAPIQGAAINATCMLMNPLAVIVTVASPSYMDLSVLAGVSYEYDVTALCEDTTSTVCLYPSESKPSNTVVVTIAPKAPTGLGVNAQ